MALSDKQTLPKGKNLIGGNASDSRHNPNEQKDQMRSYAQILKSDQTRDTFDLKSFTSEELGQLTEGGQLLIQARDKDSVVVSTEQFFALQVNFKDLATVLRNQFPDALGLRIRNVSQTTKYFEINFRSDAAREAALKKGFSYDGKKVIVSRTFPKDTTIVRVSVNNLPYEDETILKEQMSRVFAEYGEILEMGLLHTVHGHFFTGRGFVTLNLLPGKKYTALGPQIDSWEAGETLKITFTGMKPACSRCHVTDHVFGNCPVMGQRLKCCYICNKPDHLQAKCPDAFWNQRKKAAKLNSAHSSPHQQKTVTKMSANTPSTSDKTTKGTVVAKEKDTHPIITGIVSASNKDHTNSKPTTTAVVTEVPNPSATGATDGKEDTTNEKESQDNGSAPANEVQTEDSPLHQKTLDEDSAEAPEEAEDYVQEVSDEDMFESDDDDDDDANIDVNMNEAEKEAEASSKPLAEVVIAMKRKIKLQKRIAKARQMLNADKDKALRLRSGGSSSKKKGSAKTQPRL